MLVLVVTWIFFDPFVQAVYTVRSFRLESLETGEDLRAGLRRIRDAASLVAALALLTVVGPPARAAIPPEALRESIRQAMQSPEYDWRLPPVPRPKPADRPWLVEVTDRMIAHARGFLARIGDAIGRFVRWLVRQLTGGMPAPAGGAPPGGLHWSVGLITAIVLCAGAWFVWRWRRARRSKPEPASAEAVQAVSLDAEDLSPARLPEEQWLDLAARSLRDGDYRLALRALYLANLAWLGQREFLTLHSGKTNREYEAELRRRGRAFPEARALFAANLAMFERAWYGTSAVADGDIAEFRRRAEEIKQRLQSPAEVAA
jgi:hypothetical protein